MIRLMRMAVMAGYLTVALGCSGAVTPAPSTPTTPHAGGRVSVGPSKPPGYLEAEVLRLSETDGGAAVMLVVGELPDKIVPIFIGINEAAAIQLRLDGTSAPRPLTHDLLDSVLARLGATIVQVQIDELRDSTYLGSIIIRDRGRTFRLDARPSDSIALAIRSRAPIYIARSVVDHAAVDRDVLRTAPPSVPTT
ncbi:MAG: bifunctional nuclease family protein [Kofleriaceae bacterium]